MRATGSTLFSNELNERCPDLIADWQTSDSDECAGNIRRIVTIVVVPSDTPCVSATLRLQEHAPRAISSGILR
jgi:hypothetical protein